MAIDFTAVTQNVVWADPPASALGLTTKSIELQFNRSAPAGLGEIFFIYGTTTNELTIVVLDLDGASFDAGKFSFFAFWSTTQGTWRTTNDVLVVGENHIVITYSGSATTNDPVFYHQGASVAVTETSTPVGTYRVGTSSDIYLGSQAPNVAAIVNLRKSNVFSSVLTASDALDLYNGKLAFPNYKSLVFAPDLVRAAGVSNFDGAVLGASNTITDIISGAAGVPSGSPIGRADNALVFEGVV